MGREETAVEQGISVIISRIAAVATIGATLVALFPATGASDNYVPLFCVLIEFSPPLALPCVALALIALAVATVWALKVFREWLLQYK